MKKKSAVLLILSVFVIGILAYIGAFGLNVGDYRVKSFNEMIKKVSICKVEFLL